MIRNHSMSSSATPPLLGSEDPLMIRESEDLLSQFMRSSSLESHDNHAQPQSAQRPSTGSGAHRASPKSRVRIPRSRVQLRPETVPPTRSPAHVGPRIKLEKPSLISQKSPPPPARRKPRQSSPPVIDLCQSPSIASESRQSSSSVVGSRQSSSPASDDEARHMAPRRSRRAKGPTNYYKKAYHIESESEEELQEVASPRELPHRGRRTCQPSASTTPPPLPARQATTRKAPSLGTVLQRRELGSYYNSLVLQSQFGRGFRPSKAWKGASNDVITLTWSPDGTKFAAGATAHCDEHMMAYNRKNNLILGNLVSNELHELPDHWIARPRGVGSANHAVNDPRLFMSVSSVQWYEDTLYTASYDHTVKLWDTSRRKAKCFKTLKHGSQVIVMARSRFDEKLLATGTHTINLWDTETEQCNELVLPRARSKKDIELVPTSISWGANPAIKDFLLAGMSDKEDNGIAQHGLLAAFRVHESSVSTENFSPNSQNVFDVAWHPVLPVFATACTAGQQAPRGTRSVVNIYEPLRHNRRVLDLDCPAQDMNEVVFCPLSTNYISASCTDGITYVWDQRNPGEILQKLAHGQPLNQIDETIPRELADTGVTLHTWGNSYDQLYTGASDGVLKRWNIFRASEDALVEDVATLQEGIMCGALAPDKSNMLVGDVSGGVQLLSNCPISLEEDEPSKDHAFTFIESTHDQFVDIDLDTGVQAARELILTGQITRHPVFGPGQGPHYKGPFAAWARPEGTPLDQIPTTPLAEKYSKRQLDHSGEGLKSKLHPDVEANIALAKIRNQRRGAKKRRTPEDLNIKKESFDESNIVDLCSDDDPIEYRMARKRKQQTPEPDTPIITAFGSGVIDLTGDSSEEEPVVSVEDVLDDLDEDFWWPPSGSIDPNWPKES
ncbi:WD40-repeat-containing domain protein [Aspergillus keveii]|uniref:WD40-repeat-containing domain protein n=1 Tax=Aspergillus keveii TaxID=714993 RepID=A0ABR4G581_9EURO